MARGTQLAVALSFAVLFVPRSIEACSCAHGIPLCESFWLSSAVFVGEAVEIADIETRNAVLRRHVVSGKRVTFRVERSFRGPTADELVVQTGTGGGDCGYSFRRGQKYLVFASAWNGGLNVNVCGRTQ